MVDPWTILRRGGVPLGAALRSGSERVPLAAELAQAARRVIVRHSELSDREREALLAWLCAWASHFHESFIQAFGEDLGTLSVPLRRAEEDRGRHVKLRRIALDHLCAVL